MVTATFTIGILSVYILSFYSSLAVCRAWYMLKEMRYFSWVTTLLIQSWFVREANGEVISGRVRVDKSQSKSWFVREANGEEISGRDRVDKLQSNTLKDGPIIFILGLMMKMQSK